MNSILKKLNDALRPKLKAAPADLRHDNEVQILESLYALLNTSATGRVLLSYAQDCGLKVHVLRGNIDNFGYFPEKSTVYISCPAGVSMPTARAVAYLVSGLREAMLEGSGLKRPSPNIGKERFLAIHAERDKDIALHQVKVVYEIHQATGLLEIFDEFKAIGYGSLLEAYKLDMAEEASKN